MYKLVKNPFSGQIDTVEKLDNHAFIPFDPANVDFANFKAQINADEAQLENSEGVLMSAEEAKEYVKSLP